MSRKSKKPDLVRGWALYLRTSDEEAQAPERSQTSQRRVIMERLVDPSGVPVIVEYADTYSGRSTDRRNYNQLLEDARLGKFSHVGIAFVDRFGRNDVEGIRAFDELVKLGITARVATYPNLDPATPDGRMIVGMLFSMARFESDRIGQRSKEGMHTKLLEGGWPWRAPDGYLNKEMKSNMGSHSDKVKNARYKRWVEIDPEQSRVWRYAWDMLLEDQMTFEEMCEKLHAKGFVRGNGLPFVYTRADGKIVRATKVLSRAFHNWFYAGWVAIDNDWASIPPKQVRGQWEPIVTTEEFEEGLRILEERNVKKNHKRKHFYLLQSLVYLKMENGKFCKLSCSTSNTRRPGGGTAYYCIPSSSYNVLCRVVDQQIADYIVSIQVDEQHLPDIRQAYIEELDRKLKRPVMSEEAALSAALKGVSDEEARAARLYASGKITDEVWDTLWREWRDRRSAINSSLKELDKRYSLHVANLDAALTLIAKLGILYGRLDQHDQQKVLRLVVNRVMIDATGTIIRMDLRPPFTYLHALRHGGENGRGNSADQGKTKTSSADTAYLTRCPRRDIHRTTVGLTREYNPLHECHSIPAAGSFGEVVDHSHLTCG
ncbi:MAG: recombinase family protein [Chloroflexi bacterium]|nr:recombinase family protein [Chloroflexota bacterium]